MTYEGVSYANEQLTYSISLCKKIAKRQIIKQEKKVDLVQAEKKTRT